MLRLGLQFHIKHKLAKIPNVKRKLAEIFQDDRTTETISALSLQRRSLRKIVELMDSWRLGLFITNGWQ